MPKELKSVLVHPTLMRYHEVTKADIVEALREGSASEYFDDLVDAVWKVLTK